MMVSTEIIKKNQAEATVEVTVENEQKTFFGRRENENIVIYSVGADRKTNVVGELQLPNTKQWENDAHFIRNVINAYEKWVANTIG